MKYVIKKIASLVITLLIISFVTFLAFSVIPGDAAASKLGMDATEEQVEALREAMGLNDPVPVKYVRWLGNVLKGDFGDSYRYNMPVTQLISDRLGATLGLAFLSLALILVLSVPLSLLSAAKPNGAVDNVLTVLTQIGMAVPQFFLGIVLTLVFGILLSWFNTGGYVNPKEDFGGFLRFMLLPAISVAIPKLSMMVKYLRDCIVSEKKNDYVRTAKAKGNGEAAILFGHVLKNAVISAITFFAMIAAEAFAGSIVVEQVFGIPGLGRLLVNSISNRDFPVVNSIVLYMAALVVVMNTLADISYRIVDPRVSRAD